MSALAVACGAGPTNSTKRTGNEPTPPTLPPVSKPTPPPTKPLPPVQVEAPPAGRLGDNVVPKGYRLHVDLTPGQRAFSGTVEIDVTIAKRTSSVWLHGRNLRIVSAKLVRSDVWGPRRRRTIGIKALPAIRARGLIGFDFGVTVAKGNATLVFEFQGRMRARTGLFHQRYGSHWYAYTDLEPKDARRAFPCFDDPRFKVPWTIALTVPKGQRAFANTAMTKRTPRKNGRERFDFKPTPPLPSYLVAFAAGPFEVVPAKGTTSVPLRIITLKGMAKRAGYAAKHSPGLLAATEKYFGMKSPYKKLDLIAVPFFSGAMENPGLITVGAHILLLPDKPPPARRKMFAIVVSHEFAHLWFGDLVTMSYWNDLWLNEGFATWMSDKMVASHDAKLGSRVEEVRNKADAMLVDRGSESRAIRASLTPRQRIDAPFDPLTYKKAGALVTMFEAAIGQQPFRRVVRNYVGRHRHGVVTAKDLDVSLTGLASRAHIKQLSSFVTQAGIPLITMKPTCSKGQASVEVSQRPYATAAYPRKAATVWDIPICITWGDGAGTSQTTERQCFDLSSQKKMVKLHSPGCPKWVQPNANAYGYYHYELPKPWLTKLAKAKALNERERMDLLLNINASLRANRLDIATAVKALRAIARSKNQHVVRASIASLRMMAEMLTSVRQRRRLRTLIRRLVSTRARRIGLSPRTKDDYDASAIRNELVVFTAMFARDPQLLRAAKLRANRWLKTKKGIPAAELALTLQLAGVSGNKELFDRLEKALAKTRNQVERRAISKGLGSFSQPALIKRAIELIASRRVRGLEVLELLENAFMRPATRTVAYTPAAKALLTGRSRMFPALQAFLPMTFASACSKADLASFDRLFKSHGRLNGEAKHRFKQARTRARQRITECMATRAALGANARRYFR